MSLLVFYYCICIFLCHCHSFNPPLGHLSSFLLSLRSLFQGHVACRNFTLTGCACLGERQMHLGLVRAHLGYATQVWAPRGREGEGSACSQASGLLALSSSLFFWRSPDLDNITFKNFKSVLYGYYSRALAINYDPDSPRSFKSICLKCNTARFLDHEISCCMWYKLLLLYLFIFWVRSNWL